MEQLNFPNYEFRFKKNSENNFIFDEIRNKYVVLTPEEWVRQNLIQYLIKELNYPKNYLSVEKQISVFKTAKRPDVVVFDKQLKPKVIVECKRPKIPINNTTMEQIINYFLELKTEYLILTNGILHYCCRVKNKKVEFLTQIPTYDKL